MTETDPAGQPPAPAPDYHVHLEPEPSAQRGDSIPWTADPGSHLSDAEAHLVDDARVSEPLPVCEYTGDGDEPCEEPAVQRRWSGVAVVIAARNTLSPRSTFSRMASMRLAM